MVCHVSQSGLHDMTCHMASSLLVVTQVITRRQLTPRDQSLANPKLVLIFGRQPPKYVGPTLGSHGWGYHFPVFQNSWDAMWHHHTNIFGALGM